MFRRAVITSFAGYPESLSFFCPDTGLAKIASLFKEGGSDVVIMDFNNLNTYEEIVSKINKSIGYGAVISSYHEYAEEIIFEALNSYVSDVDLLAVKIWPGPSLDIMLRIISKLKKQYPQLTVVLGGPTIKSNPKYFCEICSDGNIDYIVASNEQDFAKCLYTDDLRYPAGVYFWTPEGFRAGTKIVQESIIIRNFDFSASTYKFIDDDKIHVFILDTTQHCKKKCPFCAHRLIQRECVETTHAQVLDELYLLREQFGVNAFRLSASCPSKDLLLKISQYITQKKWKMKFSSFLSINETQGLDIQQLSQSGLVSTLSGIESPFDDVQKNCFCKPVCRQHVVDYIDAANRAGILPCFSFIYPYPQYRQYSSKEFVDSWKETSGAYSKSGINVFFPILYPHTEWWRELEKFKFKITDKNAYANYLYRSGYSFSALRPSGFAIDGIDAESLIDDYKKFNLFLKESGFALGLTDELCLMANIMKITPFDLLIKQVSCLKRFDADGLRNIFQIINREARLLRGI